MAGDQTTNSGTGGLKTSTTEALPPNTKSGSATEIAETTSQRRQKFVRQKSFEIDSDSTDTSLADISNIVSEVRIGF